MRIEYTYIRPEARLALNCQRQPSADGWLARLQPTNRQGPKLALQVQDPSQTQTLDLYSYRPGIGPPRSVTHHRLIRSLRCRPRGAIVHCAVHLIQWHSSLGECVPSQDMSFRTSSRNAGLSYPIFAHGSQPLAPPLLNVFHNTH
jgi:hypothetical protein